MDDDDMAEAVDGTPRDDEPEEERREPRRSG